MKTRPEDLATWQKRLGMTDQQVANELGVHRVAWSRWKHGHRPEPSWLRLALLGILARRAVTLTPTNTGETRWQD